MSTEKIFEETFKIDFPEKAKMTQKDIPKHFRSSKIVEKDNKLDKDIKWHTTTLKMFEIGNFKECLRWRVRNQKPIFITIEGESGEGKTNVMIHYLNWMLSVFAKVTLNKDNFLNYYWLARNIDADPRYMSRKFSHQETCCIDEIYLLTPHPQSTQTRAFLDFADMIRQKRIFLIGALPSSRRLPPDYFLFKNNFQIIVDYTDIDDKYTKFDVLFNCMGRNANNERIWKYILLEEDVKISFADKALWKLATKRKYSAGYGESIEGFQTFKDERKSNEDEAIDIMIDTELNKVFEKCKDEENAVKALLKLKEQFGSRMNYTRIESQVRSRIKDSKMNYRRIKRIEETMNIAS